ncbi:hypothetical protein ADL03_17825, partial [Nocardia sp. NRRL S-836]
MVPKAALLDADPMLLPTTLLLTALLTPPTTRYSWPLPPPHPVVRAFLAPTSPFGPGHRGVDLAAPT